MNHKNSRVLRIFTPGGPPNASAFMKGAGKNAAIHGAVDFYQIPGGVLVVANIAGLPFSMQKCQNSFFGFHIHSGTRCSGNRQDPFADAMTHYDPKNCPHPYHSGDLPPLLGAHGRAFSAFFTDRFTVNEILGKTVIIHSRPDDFTSQPAGNAGEKIACGVIVRNRR